ncbi:hypothetical protein MOKP64_12800 [Mycobacterium avium subsp. hominissuis]
MNWHAIRGIRPVHDADSRYDKLRERCSILYSTDTGKYVVTDYRVIRDILMDNVGFSNERANVNPFGDVRGLIRSPESREVRYERMRATGGGAD